MSATAEERERLLEWARIEDGMPWAADVRRAVADRLGENPWLNEEIERAAARRKARE
jgi:hypothetical protein